MVKLLFKTITFFILFLFLIKSSEKLFIKEDRFNYSKHYFDKVSDTLNIDILFFGSSKSYCSYNPTIIKHNLGFNSYNLAGQGQVLEVTNFVIDEALKTSLPKLIVVDLSNAMLTFNLNDSIAEESKSYQLKIFDNYKLSLRKLKHMSSIYRTKDLFNVISPIIRNHNSWNNIFKANYKKDYLSGKNNYFLFNNGYIGTMHEMNKEGLNIAKKLNLGYEALKNEKQLKPSPKEVEMIEKTINIAKKHNVQILFVTAPSIKGYINHLSFYESLENIFKEKNINYINLNKYFNEIGLTVNDFKDIQHMNYNGGFKTSQFLSKYISETFKLKNNNKYNNLDNNVTYHMLSSLNRTNEVINKPFQFDSIIGIKEVAYFKELENRYVFLLKLKEGIDIDDFNNYRGYLRLYKEQINDLHKQVIDFPLKVIDVGDEKYIFARGSINETYLSQLDIFFINKKNKKSSKFYTIKDITLKNNEIR